MSASLIAGTLTDAGQRIFNTIITQARARAASEDEAIYTILEHWAMDAQTNADFEGAFRQAYEGFEAFTDNGDYWRSVLTVLFEHGGEHIEPFADHLWRTYIFQLQDGPELLWNSYPNLYRAVGMHSEVKLPTVWGELVLAVEGFMTLAEEYLADNNTAFLDLVTTEALERLFEPQTSTSATSPLDTTFEDFITDVQFHRSASLHAYLRASLDQIGSIDPRGYLRSESSKRIPVSRICVPLEVEAFGRRERPDDLMRYHLASYALPDHVMPSLAVGVSTSKRPTHKLQDIVRQNALSVVLGPAGGGKTLMLRQLVHELSETLLDFSGEPAEIEADQQGAVQVRLSQPLPIYVDLGLYIDEREPGETLEQYTLRSVIELSGEDDIIRVVADLVSSGRCLFLLDGLDQAASEEQRRSLVAYVVGAARHWASQGNRVVVTGRLPGYEAAPLPPDFKPYMLRGLTKVQIGSFVYRWTMMLLRAQQPFLDEATLQQQAEIRMMNIRRDLGQNPELVPLVSNPLMLRLLISAYQPGMVIHASQAGLIQRATEAINAVWRQPARGGEPSPFSDNDLVAILGQVAAWMQESRASGRIEVDPLEDIVTRIIDELHPEYEQDDARQAAAHFMSLVADGEGVLIDLGQGQVGFIFHAIQEYYAARHLIASYRYAGRRLRTRLHDPRWINVIHMALGYTALGSQEDASDLLEIAVLAWGEQAESEEYEASPFEPLLNRDLFFAARLLANGVQVRPDIAHRIVEGLMTLWVNGDRDSAGRMNLIFDHVRRLLSNLKGTTASRLAFQQALAAAENGNDYQRAFAIDALTFWPEWANDAVAFLTAQDREQPLIIQQATVRALGRMPSLSVAGYDLLIYYAIDPDGSVADAARAALRKLPPPPPDAISMWLSYLRSDDQSRWPVALLVLRQVGVLPESVIGELLHLMNVPDEARRLDVIETVGAISNLPGMALISICRVASTTQLDVRIAAIRALRRPSSLPDEVIEHLIEWTYDPDPRVRREAADVLGMCLNTSRAIQEALLERIVDDGSDSLRAHCVELLARKGAGQRRVAHMLRHVITDTVDDVRRAIARSLRHFPDATEDLHVALDTLLRDADMVVREETLESMTYLHEPGLDIVNQYLVPLLHGRDSNLAERALGALASARDLPADALLPMVDALPQRWETHGEAVATCLKHHKPLSMDVISSLLDLADPRGQNGHAPEAGLQAIALEVLGDVLPDAPDVTNVLVQAARSASSELIQRAALRGLTGAQAMWPDIQMALTELVSHGPMAVRCEAARTLGALIRTLPDPGFQGRELLDVAGDVFKLIDRTTPRAAWEPDTALQNELLHALYAIVARADSRPPMLAA